MAMSLHRSPVVRIVVAVCAFLLVSHFILRDVGSLGTSSASKSSVDDGKKSGESRKVVGSSHNFLNGQPNGVTYPANDYFKEPTLPDVNNTEVRATFVSLARNSDLNDLLSSIREVEAAFNSKFHYGWVFLNEQEFTDEFKQRTTEAVSGPTQYGFIEADQWGYPSHVDQSLAEEEMQKMQQAGVIYGGSLPYRHMCRYQSGFFWRHPLMEQYEYYWRVEPGIKIHCDIDYDPFKYMKQNDKKYSFVITLPEYAATIPTLWRETRNFLQLHPESIADNNAWKFLTDDEGRTYGGCHFWSNFEIAALDTWRTGPFPAYFDYLDSKGGFFYERWGDAPVHSIAASIFLRKDQIHFFNDIGYYHVPFTHCPVEESFRSKCRCKPEESFDWNGWSCLSKWFEVTGMEKPANHGDYREPPSSS